ncbi:MAG: hypothetical protein GIX03_07975 [Candidatus Eremiobacteraeota bacterium]|nr:hypothetical protein [Candidatus Eremiobacteraeota bacterium]
MLLAAAFVAAQTLGSLAWRYVGPAVAGGRVAAVAGSDRNALLYYLGAAGGGVFRTTNGGLTWRDVWPSSSVGAIGAVAVAASNPQVVWAGTGEATPRNDASYGDGVWRSTDGAKHWTWRGLPDSYAIAKILIDPHDPNRVLVGALGNPFRDTTARGVFLTADGGRSWRRTLYVGPQSGVSDMDADPHDPRVIYAGMWQFRRVPWTFTSGGPQDGLYKSTDGGRTWCKLRGGLPEGLMGRIGVAVAPSNPNRVYALIQSRDGLLWRSDDAGAHWRMMSSDTLIDQRPFYMSRLSVDPTNRNHVFFASENLIETHDGGNTFQDDHNAVHQDHHGFWISRDGSRIIEANDGGAPISVDGGKLWDWRFNLTLAQTYHVGYDETTPYRLCGAFQDNDSYCGPSNSLSPLGITQRDWRDVGNDGDGVAVWPEPGDPESVWNVGINELNGQLGIFDLASRQNYDITPSVTDTNGRDIAADRYRFNWEAPLAFSPKRPGVAYFGANAVFETHDRGRTWRAISPDLTRNDAAKQRVAGGPINTDVSGAEFYDTVLDIAPSPVDRDVIWTGTDDGVIERTADGGAHWTNVTPGDIAWSRVECIEPSRVSANRAYAVVDRHLLGDPTAHLYETDDAGRTWRRIDAGLPRDQIAHVVREDPLNPQVLYAGLERGVWASFDGGTQWTDLRLRMPPVAIRDLRIQPQERDLIAGTHGRGLWILDDLTPIERLSDAQRLGVPTLFAPRSAHTWYFWWASGYPTGDNECCTPAGASSGENPPYGAIVSYYLPRALGALPRLDVLDARGRLVRRLKTTNRAGLNRSAWDLSEEPPTPLVGARAWNHPSDGPMVVPGRYTLRLDADGRSVTQPLDVLPDLRARWTQADYEARYDFLRSLDAELSAIDDALNRMQTVRAHGNASRRRAIDGLAAQLTSGVVNSEDDQWKPDRLRERVTILQGDVALSQGPPLAPHQAEAAAIRQDFDRVMSSYGKFLTTYHIAPRTSASEDQR